MIQKKYIYHALQSENQIQNITAFPDNVPLAIKYIHIFRIDTLAFTIVYLSLRFPLKIAL